MKLFISLFSAVLIVGLVMALGSCTNIAVDPIVPVTDKPDTNIVSNKVTFTIDLPQKSYTLLEGEQLQLSAKVVMHKDARSTDSTVRNYVLRDSSIYWSIVSGRGTISADGLYAAPQHLIQTTEEVRIVARASVDAQSSNTVVITLRTPNLIPLSIGSYWIRTHTPLDTLTLLPIESQQFEDSTVASAVVDLQGKTATQMLSYRDGVVRDTAWFSNDGNNVWSFYQPDPHSTLGVLGPQWLKVIDRSASQWTVIDTTLMNVPIIFNNKSAYVMGRVQIVCSVRGNDSAQCDIGTMNAKKIVTLGSVDLRVYYNGISIPIRYSTTLTQWYADGVGCIKAVDEMVQTLSVLSSDQHRSGVQTVLKRAVIR